MKVKHGKGASWLLRLAVNGCFSWSVVSLWRATVDLLVDLLQLLRLLLGYVEPNREIVVVLYEFLDCAGAVLKVSRQIFALFGQLLHHIGDLDAVKCGLSKLLVLAQKTLVDAFKLLDVTLDVTQHSVCALKLLD